MSMGGTNLSKLHTYLEKEELPENSTIVVLTDG